MPLRWLASTARDTRPNHHLGEQMIRLTCILRRKQGMSPKDFHAYWRDHHGPLVASTRNGSHVLRYEQHPRPLDDYEGDDDPGFDGVTIQWYSSMGEYEASLAEDDTSVVMEDVAKFLDTTSLHFVLTEEPRIVIEGPSEFQPSN